MSENTLDKEIRKHFVFQDDHIFDSQGDTPYLAHQCKKCDKLSSHHLQYDALSTLRDLITNREKQMLEFVIGSDLITRKEEESDEEDFGVSSRVVHYPTNIAINSEKFKQRQRAKEWRQNND